MSNFKMNAVNKETGTTHEVWCMDNYFGNHLYGYTVNESGALVMTEDEFYRKFDPKEPE